MSNASCRVARALVRRLRHDEVNSKRFSPLRNLSSGRYSKPNSTTPGPGLASSNSIGHGSGTFTSSSPGRVPEAATVLDPVQEQERRAYHMRRMRFAGIGLLLTITSLTALLWNLDLEEMDKSSAQKPSTSQRLDADDAVNHTFQGKDVHVVGLGPDKRIYTQGQGAEIELVETGTSSVPHFPRTMHLPVQLDKHVAETNQGANAVGVVERDADREEYTLIGLGIRTVLFIQVYVVGMYVRTQDINSLQAKLIHSVNSGASTLVPSEKEALRGKLCDPAQSRELWSQLLEVPGLKTAWRITPTRNTDFGHLRDGFVNGINARTQEARRIALGGETEFDSQDFGQAVQELKHVFTGGKAPKGSTLILTRDQHGSMHVLFQSQLGTSTIGQVTETLGRITDERISRLIWLGYLAGDKVSSKTARDGVVDGCITFAARPIGSVESRVV